MDPERVQRLLALSDEDLIASNALTERQLDHLEARLHLRAAVLGWTGHPLKQPLEAVAAEVRAVLRHSDELLAVKRQLRHAPMPWTACFGIHRTLARKSAEEAVETWNRLVPLGTLVRFYPTWGDWENTHTDLTEAPARLNTAGEPILWLHKQSGCVSLWHCEPIVVPSCYQPRPVSQGAAP